MLSHGRRQLLSSRLHLLLPGGPALHDGTDNISTVSLSTLTAYLDAVQAPIDTLGWGAGLTTSATGNYFAPGTTPSVDRQLRPVVGGEASHLQLSYSVENDASLNAETVPTATTIDLPTTASALASIPLTLPAADQQPGPYLVQASLSTPASRPSDPAGDHLHSLYGGRRRRQPELFQLPAGSGAGGPADPRGVALNAQLGLDGLRALSFEWSNFFPTATPRRRRRQPVGPSAMTFTNAPTSYFQAAAEGVADHVAYWIQISGGDPVSGALVSNGWWGADIQALVAYYSHPPAGCSGCAPVTMWEPWNESNNTGWGNATDYVNEVLKPFYHAVKAAEPGSQLDGHRRIDPRTVGGSGGSS